VKIIGIANETGAKELIEWKQNLKYIVQGDFPFTLICNSQDEI